MGFQGFLIIIKTTRPTGVDGEEDAAADNEEEEEVEFGGYNPDDCPPSECCKEKGFVGAGVILAGEIRLRPPSAKVCCLAN